MHHQRMTSAGMSHWIMERARAAGFDLCGIAPVDLSADESSAPTGRRFAELDRLPEWLARGYAGEMKYLHDSRRGEPRSVLRSARSLIVVAMNYNSAPDANAGKETGGPRGWISKYAWGDDYHELLQQKLSALLAEMRVQFPAPFEARAYVDTGPIIERVAAKYAGLGWLAKNTFLINQQLGSWLFLGVIVTSLALQPTLADGQAPPADLCGSCTRCLDACPTDAFPEPYVLDARRCVSYLTIELRGSIPEELRPLMGNALIGCDICQDVCPWNRKAPITTMREFQPRIAADPQKRQSVKSPDSASDNGTSRVSHSNVISLYEPDLERIALLSQEEFSSIFRRSAVKRAKWRGLIRNACVALGNSQLDRDHASYSRVIRLLERLAASEDSLISEHAQWSLGRLKGAARANQIQKHNGQ